MNVTDTADDHLARILALHLDPKWGAPYWLARAGDIDRAAIRSISDLSRLGTMTPALLRERPLGYFISQKAASQPERLLLAQTGGTLGAPVWTAYRDDEFEAAFVVPFVAAAERVQFPRGAAWLYAGPTGPHVIGRAADAIARRTGSASPFNVDFDPRWARKLATGSFAARRYLEHVVDQAWDVLAHQDVGVLFSTPPVLERLGQRMTPGQRERIEGVHYGGMALSADQLDRFKRQVFPNAVHLAGYGNSLFGCCLELDVTPGRHPTYYPHGKRLVFGVVEPDQPGVKRRGTRADPPPPAPIRYDALDRRGTLAFCRLDETMLLANVIERDAGRLLPPPAGAPAGFTRGVEAPQPAADARTVAGGLY